MNALRPGLSALKSQVILSLAIPPIALNGRSQNTHKPLSEDLFELNLIKLLNIAALAKAHMFGNQVM